jgi:hypothetical protein
MTTKLPPQWNGISFDNDLNFWVLSYITCRVISSAVDFFDFYEVNWTKQV